MVVGGFSLSVTNTGNDFTIGGSGVLDDVGMLSLRQAIEESCAHEGASVALDLLAVTEMRPEAVAALIAAGDFCREKGVPFAMRASDVFLEILSAAGYGADLMPLP